MKKTVKKCPKCGKRIHVAPSEFCCPLCGEFFAEIKSNEQIYTNETDTYTNRLIENAKSNNKQERKKAISNAMINWFTTVAFSVLGIFVSEFLGIFVGPFVVTLALIVFGCIVLSGPFIPIIIGVKYKRMLNDKLISIDDSSVTERYKPSISISVLSIVAVILSLGLLAIAFIIVSQPIMIFKFAHWGWILGILVVAIIITAGLALISYFWYSKNYYDKCNEKRTGIMNRGKSILSIVGTMCSIVMIIIGFVSTPNKIHSISTIKEFEVLANMPFAEKCNYILEADLDFEGASSIGYGSIKTFTGIIDGNGHYVKNLNVNTASVNCDGNELMGLVLYNYGEIKNLNFKNCTFEAFVSGKYQNSFGILAAINFGKIDNCIFTDTYAKYYHRHSYYNRKYNILNCTDDFGYLVGKNSIYPYNGYYGTSDERYGEITNIEIWFETENQEFLSKHTNDNYNEDEKYIINDISSTENIIVIDEIGFIK